ncbi:hypothetical protein [Natranaerovirga hydrolytica]|uniref:hypothetical protein n=1 Tax=Natranaerovirga hydrolytica TaxID=680378 RepID=UPI00104442C6|nr:hypothetical protein [Natranaerovirga hydrolytica]
MYTIVMKEDLSSTLKINEGITKSKSFSITSNSTDIETSVKGTVFIKEFDRTIEKIQIVSYIEIDPNDWGGVAFYIPKHLNIKNIVSSYPETEYETTSDDYIAIFKSAKLEHEWSAFIEIGKDSSYESAIGGSGMVVIDLIPDKKSTNQLESFNFLVGIGSDEENGIKILHPDVIEIPISIMID